MLKSNYLLFLFVALLIQLQSVAQINNRLNELEKIAKVDPDSLISMVYSEQLTKLDEPSKNYLLAFANEKLGNYFISDSLLNKGISQYSFENDSSLYIKYLTVAINHKKILDDFDGAYQMVVEVLDYSKRNQDTLSIISTYVLMGEFFRASEDFAASLQHLNIAAKLAQKYSQEVPRELQARILNRKAASLLQSKIYLDSVEFFSRKAIQIAKDINDLDLEATSLNELGFLYLNAAPIDHRSETFLLKAIQLWDSLGYAAYATNARINLARYYIRTSKPEKGISNLLAVEDEIMNSKRDMVKGEYYDMLSLLYSNVGNYPKAFNYSQESKKVLLSVLKCQYQQRIKLSSAQLVAELNLSSKQAKLNQFEFETKTKKKENTILYITLICFAVIGGFLIYFLISTNKQKIKFRNQQSQIIEMNNELTDLIGEKETLLKEVNHRVKNNLSVLSSLLYLQQKKIENPEVKSAIKDSLLRINTISLVHESLYQRNDMSQVDFHQYLEKLVNYNKSIYWGNRELEVTINCKSLTPDLSTSVPLAMIINEMVTNSFKYAFQNVSDPKIDISYKNHTLIYSDNGPGKKDEAQHESLGLKLISIFSQQIGASITTEIDESGFHYFIKLSRT